ncbi:SCL-interrupting locus protein homolog [Parambassis ranga]|uniref:SCL-interrupting locus protein homolog n=1 Tax=Parambassis ranga TaxID=210632 RepID=A0A6P7I7D6_9TELE|nr:SCL-interrupting locus protein [Parambassis ranga]
MSCPVNLQALPSAVLEEVFTPENIRRRPSANSVSQLSFPTSRSALWDSSPAGEKLGLRLCSHRKPRLVLLEKALRLAQRHARHSITPRLHCFFLGSLSVDSDEESVTITLDRFDPGRDQAGASGRVPSALLPGDVVVPCLFSTQAEVASDAAVQSEAELHHCFKMLQQAVSSRQTLDLSQLLKIRGRVLCSQQLDAAAFSLSWSAVCPSVSLDVQPVRPLPIIPTALLRSLTSISRSLQHSSRQRGFLTMDQTRKLVLLLESDPKASSLPLVGLWLSGVTHVYNPQVWACCLRFLFSSSLQDRVLSESGLFLLLVFGSTHRAPQFFQCRGPRPGLGSGPQLDCQMLSASQAVTLYQQVALVDGQTLQFELGSEEHSRQVEVFREAQSSFSSAPPAAGLSISDQDSGVEDEDLSPRPSPSPHLPAHQARRVQPSVPELSLLIDSSFASNHNPGLDSGSSHRAPSADRKSAPPTGTTTSSTAAAQPPPPHLHSTPNSNLQQPCSCCSTHTYNCTSIVSSPGPPTPAAAASPSLHHLTPAPSSHHHSSCPSSLHPTPPNIHPAPTPSSLHPAPSLHRHTPPPSGLHSSSSHPLTLPPSSLYPSPAPPPASSHHHTPPSTNHPPPSVLPTSTHQPIPPSFSPSAPPPAPASHRHTLPPHSSNHHHTSFPCSHPPPLLWDADSPSPHPSCPAADPASPPWFPRPSCVNPCCDPQRGVIPSDTYQLLLHQDRQLRLLQAQVQMLLETQGKFQSASEVTRSTASVAVGTGASLFWGHPVPSVPHLEEQAPPCSPSPPTTPRPSTSSASSPSVCPHDLPVDRPAGGADNGDVTGQVAPCSPSAQHSFSGVQSPVLGESVSMYAPADEQQSFYQNLMTQLTSRLQESDNQQAEEEEESRRRSPSVVSDRSQSSRSSQSSASSSGRRKQQQQRPAGDPVVSATLRQLQQLGVDMDKEDLTESDRSRLKAVESASTLASINPAAVLSRLSVSEPSVSALFPGGSVDLSLEANAIALRYLNDSQLSRLSLGGHVPRVDPIPSSSGDSLLSPSNMSLATRKYMKRYGLIEEEEEEEEEEEVRVREESVHQPLTEALNMKLLPQNQFIQDLRPKMQLLASGAKTSSSRSDKENRPSLLRASSRQTEGSVGNILDLSRLRQLPKLF